MALMMGKMSRPACASVSRLFFSDSMTAPLSKISSRRYPLSKRYCGRLLKSSEAPRPNLRTVADASFLSKMYCTCASARPELRLLR